jgi:methionine biosynthesis protein MetW
MVSENIRLDHNIIYSIIEPGSRVLDLGCGAGELLYPLVRDKQIRAQGIELADKPIQECVKKGLSVFQGDIENSLREYPDNAFDYVILNQSMQEVRKVDCVIHEALRIPTSLISSHGSCCFSMADRRSRNPCLICGLIHQTCAF